MVRMTVLAAKIVFALVTTPSMRLFLTMRSSSKPCLTSRCGWFSTTSFMRNWYAFLSACARGACTAGSSAPIEHAKLQARGVNIARHFTAQRVNFAHHVAFCYAANGRVARHLRDGVEIHGQQQRFTSHARRGQRGFCTCMSAANNNDVVFFFRRSTYSFLLLGVYWRANR